MQSLLTYAVEFTCVAFALLFAADFIHGLLPKPVNTVVPPSQWAIAFEPINDASEHYVQIPVKYATLDWVKPCPDKEVSSKCAIALAKNRILSTLKQYKLRGESVVRVADIPFSVDAAIRRYKLRSQDVIKLSHLAAA